MPLPENPFFTGRKEALDELKKNLDKSGIYALTGLGGMGKTQTAAQYAHHHRKDYAAVLWVKAESQETLFADLSQLAGRLGLPESSEKDQSVAVEATKRWLDEHEGWLLVLDNVEDYKVVRDLARKASANGHHVVITTQTSALGTIGRQKLSPMDHEQGALLLLLRANRLEEDAPLSAADSKGGRSGAGDFRGSGWATAGAGPGRGVPRRDRQRTWRLLERCCASDARNWLERRGGLDSDHLPVAANIPDLVREAGQAKPGRRGADEGDGISCSRTRFPKKSSPKARQSLVRFCRMLLPIQSSGMKP